MTEKDPFAPTIVAWYAGDPAPPRFTMRIGEGLGLPSEPPRKPKDRVRVLRLAGFDDEDLVAAVPELDADLVIQVSYNITNEVGAIFHGHLKGLTPLEISRDFPITRPKVYYWLNRFNLKPHRHVREELTARQRAQIVQVYQRGDRLVDIASRFNVSYDQVRYAVRNA